VSLALLATLLSAHPHALQGLKMFPAMVIVPTLQICWTLFSILSGMLYFQEYQEMHALAASMFCLGVAVSEAATV
jgi:hypothetical protein